MGFLIFDFGFSIFSRSRSARCTQQWATGRRQSPDGRQQPPVGRQRAAINNQKSTIKNQKWLLLLLLATALPRLAIAADSITVIQDNAPVMSGRTILTRLARGTKLPVKRTQGSWYGVNVQVDGKRTFGWVHRKYVVPTKQAASVETQAQQAFEKLKAEADKLAAQGKYQEAIDLVDSFPERYWHTAAQNKVRELGLALEKRASGDPKFLEAEAEAEFHKCKSAAETLVKQGKLAEAVQALAAFPGKYAQTRWGKELLQYRIELE